MWSNLWVPNCPPSSERADTRGSCSIFRLQSGIQEPHFPLCSCRYRLHRYIRPRKRSITSNGRLLPAQPRPRTDRCCVRPPPGTSELELARTSSRRNSNQNLPSACVIPHLSVFCQHSYNKNQGRERATCQVAQTLGQDFGSLSRSHLISGLDDAACGYPPECRMALWQGRRHGGTATLSSLLV